jgi:hypothetical protein
MQVYQYFNEYESYFSFYIQFYMKGGLRKLALQELRQKGKGCKKTGENEDKYLI